MKYSPEAIQKLYLKRWSSLSVKMLVVQDRIVNAYNEHTAAYLRDYLEEINKIKTEEKETFKTISL
jgi:hypothetical protein